MKKLTGIYPRQQDTHKHPAMRLHIEDLLNKGWSITGRDPVRLELGVQVKTVRNGVLNG